MADAPRRKRPLKFWVALLVIPNLLGAAGYFAYQRWFDTYHLKAVQPGALYRDGNQSMREFKTAVGRVKPKTVVCLVDEKEVADPDKPQFKQEMEYLQSQGIAVKHIPVKLGGWPTSEDVRQFLETASKPEQQPVLVHCAQGVRRTGMMVAAYQMSVQGMDKEKAKAAIETFGHSERTVGDVKKFIDIYDPANRAVTTTMPVGRE
jgi:protein tyrosine phosphatase (PTP) superfamily phosphohydrolase (DUF442 family)